MRGVRNSRCALVRLCSSCSLSFHFLVSRMLPETNLGLSSSPFCPLPQLVQTDLHLFPDQTPASLGFRLQWSPGSPSLWATSLTNFPVGREIYIQQKGGSVCQALTQFEGNCLWALISRLFFLLLLLLFLPRILFQTATLFQTAHSLTFFSSFLKDPASLNHNVSSLHPFLPHPIEPWLCSEANPPSFCQFRSLWPPF